jgi:tRNA-dihydrouridine synthase A
MWPYAFSIRVTSYCCHIYVTSENEKYTRIRGNLAKTQCMNSSVKIGSSIENNALALDRRICVAPMMDYTDRHFRFLLRLMSPTALLYTEMINAHAIVRGDRARHLAFDRSEHPVALQLGGNDPLVLAQAAEIGAEFGYDEVNLNCGCPSDRVQSGRFGACLMAEPQRVADCVEAMRARVDIPVTVKCRIGIEPNTTKDDYEFLRSFVAAVAAAGCTVVILHARKAILTGLSPKENREIPPLRYDVAAQLRREFPNLTMIVNGGIRAIEPTMQFLREFDGVMLGREICENPYRLVELHRLIHDPDWRPTREAIVQRYVGYMNARVSEGYALAPMLRHSLALYAGQPRGRSWRRFISERAARSETKPDILHAALRIVAGESNQNPSLGRADTELFTSL